MLIFFSWFWLQLYDGYYLCLYWQCSLVRWFRWKLRHANIFHTYAFSFKSQFVSLKFCNDSTKFSVPILSTMGMYGLLRGRKRCADAVLVSSVGHAFSYQPKRGHAFCPCSYSPPAQCLTCRCYHAIWGNNSFSLFTTTSTHGIVQASLLDICCCCCFYSWEETDPRIQNVSSGSYFNQCSPDPSRCCRITLGSNKSAILLSTFSSSPFAYVDPLAL